MSFLWIFQYQDAFMQQDNQDSCSSFK